MNDLTQRDAFVLREREQGTTLQEIGIKLGISRERVRQIECRAIRRLMLNEIEEVNP